MFCAGRADQVDRPGSLVVVDLAGESVLLVRTRAGELRAHYNVCRHRGSQVVPAEPAPPGGPKASPARQAGSLRCPYHSWTYRLEGDLLRAPWTEDVDDFDPAGFGLHPVGVATWGGFLFLHLTPQGAVPLADQLGPVPERLRRYPLDTLRVGRRLAYEVGANWKLVAENYNECYHCAGVHPELCRVGPAFKRGGAGLDWERGIPHRDGAWTFTANGQSARAPFPGLDDDERTRHKGELIYPNLMLSLSADHVAAFTLWPHRPDATTIVCDLLFHPDELASSGFDPSDAADFWDLATVRTGRSATASSRAWARGPHRRLVRPHGGRQPGHPPLPPGPARARGARGGGVTSGERRDWDAIVVGLGALGSAPAFALARAGARCSAWSSSRSATTGAPPTTTPASSAAPTTHPGTCAWPTWPTGPGRSWSARRGSGWS
jgi:phenylpropionate dioxygenase-like ring-hydroxylating dioxygenase large terminal subunit